MKIRQVAMLAVLVASVMGCVRRSDENAKAVEEAGKKMEAAAKEMEKAGEDAAKGAEGMAKGLEAMAQGLGALAGAASGGKTVEPVSFKELQTAFTPLAGWEMAKPTGERMTAPVQYSEAEVRYRKGNAEIEAKIIDSAFSQLLLLPYTWITNFGYEKETENGYEKAIKVGGQPGFESWDSNNKHGELSAFVNKRFILAIEGSGIDDPAVLHQLAKATLAGKLSELK
jgi:hypothetical protein